MIKKYLFLVVFIALYISGTAQTANVLQDGLQLPSSMVGYDHEDGKRLYFSEWLSGKIAYVNLDDVASGVTEVVSPNVTTEDRVYGLAIYKDELYFCDSGTSPKSIKKISLTAANPTVEPVFFGFTLPYSIVFAGDIMYVGDNGANTITKIDMLAANPTPIVVAENLKGPFGLTYDEVGNMLYFTQRNEAKPGEGKVSSLNLSETNPAVVDIIADGLYTPSGIGFKNNTLYLVEAYKGNKVSKIDLTASTPKAEFVAEAGDAASYVDPSGLCIYGDTLYYTTFSYSNGTIFSMDISNMLSSATNVPSNTAFCKIIANKLHVFESDVYQITVYNVAGQLLKSIPKTPLLKGESYDLNLEQGLYFIQVENTKHTLRFKTFIL